MQRNLFRQWMKGKDDVNNIMPIHQHSRQHRFPLRIFAATFLVSMMITVFSGWQSWQMHIQAADMAKKHIALTENVGRIMLLDEVLTMSARMAAVSGDLSYEKRYDQFDPQLTREIEAVRAILPQGEMAAFVKETDDANLALVKMERQAFAWIHQDKHQEASALLASPEYVRLKKAYSDGMEKTVNTANELIERENQHLHDLSLWLVAASASGVMVLVTAWFFAIRSARAWAAERRKSEDALQVAHDTLGILVEQRTADLLGANEQLQSEITGHMQAEEALRISAQKHQLLFESSRDALMTVAPPSWKFATANQATLQMFGASSVAEFTALGPWDVSPERQPDGRPSSEKAPEMIAIAMREGSHFFEWTHQRLDGQPFDANVLLTRMEVGGDMFLLATVRDITERKQIEQSLLESEERFRKAFQYSAIGMALVGLDGHWLKVNHSLCQMIGYSEAEMLSRTFQDITPPDDLNTDLDFVAQLLAGKTDHYQMEKRYFHKDGHVVWIRLSVSLILDARHRPLHFVSQMDDITDKKLAEEKIRKLNEELEAKVQERTQALLDAQEELVRNEKLAVLGQIAGSVGHELRNPLGVMSNAVYFLQTVLSDADETTKEYLDIIKSEIAGSERIVSDLLDAVRTKPPQSAAVDVKTLIDQVLHKYTLPPSVALELDIPATLSPLRVDALQIQQVFRNLISNGVEAMPEGGKLTIRASEDTQTKSIAVSVKDSGIGMTPEQLHKLFQPLFTTKARGIGLGLVVVKNLAQANGGGVQVESAPGQGSVFTVTLPISSLYVTA